MDDERFFTGFLARSFKELAYPYMDALTYEDLDTGNLLFAAQIHEGVTGDSDGMRLFIWVDEATWYAAPGPFDPATGLGKGDVEARFTLVNDDHRQRLRWALTIAVELLRDAKGPRVYETALVARHLLKQHGGPIFLTRIA